MVAVAVQVVIPLTSLIVTRHEPAGRLLGGAKVMLPVWPGARVMICWAGNGPALLFPGPPARRALPSRSTGRPPVLSTWAMMDGCPLADRRAVMEAMAKLVGRAPPFPTARETRTPARDTSVTPKPLAARA